MRCKLCKDGVFIGQEVNEVTSHVQLHHAEVEEGEIQDIEFSCLLCCQHFKDSRHLNQHLLTHHTGKPRQVTSVSTRGNTSSPSRSKRRVFVENPEDRVVVDLVGGVESWPALVNVQLNTKIHVFVLS